MKRLLAVILSIAMLMTSINPGVITDTYAKEIQTEIPSEAKIPQEAETSENTTTQEETDLSQETTTTSETKEETPLTHGTLYGNLNNDSGKPDQAITDTDVPYKVVEYTSNQKKTAAAKQQDSQSVTTEAILLLDNSGSMTATAMNELRKSCQNFVSDMLTVDPTAKIGIVIYESDINAVTFDGEYFTNDMSALYDVIGSLESGGATAMNGGFLKADEIFSLYGNATNKYIIHMADGLANVGTYYYGSDGKYAGSNFVDIDGSAFTYTDSNKSYASAVYNTFSAIKNDYFIYSLGFFHSLGGTQKQFCGRFLSDIQNVGYQEVTTAENLTFSFENITDNIQKTHVVTFNNNGHGSAAASQTIQPNCAAAEPAPPSEQGYIFCGWYTDAACTTPYDFSAIVNDNLTLYAKWAEDAGDVSYVVNFDLNGHGDAIDAQTINSGELASKPENPSAPGYIFQGWYLDKGGKTKFYFSQKITGKTTLYAKWKDAFNFTIGNEFKLTIPKDVPVIGGGKLALDMSLIPVSFSAEDGLYKIAINVDSYEKTLGKKGENKKVWDKDAWTGFKDIVDDQKEAIKKGTKMYKDMYKDSKAGTVSSGLGKDFKINVVGYAEGKIEDEALKSIDGKISISFEIKLHNEWQTVIVVVPVVIGLEGSAALNVSGKIGYDFEDAKIFYNGELEFTLPAIKLSGGVGVSYIADISVYGQAENKINLSTDGGIKASLGGELGASAKLLLFSYSQPFLSNLDDPWEYYNSKKKSAAKASAIQMSQEEFTRNALKAESYTLSLEGVAQTGSWKEEKITAANPTSVLQQNVYSEANPQIVTTENGTKYLFFIGSDPDRSGMNKTALMYSIYDDAADTWKEPIVVEEDGTADFQPSVAVDRNRIYLSWMDMSKTYTQADQTAKMDEIAQTAEIKTAVFDGSDFTVTTLTKNNSADLSPKIAVVNHTPYVAWINNSDNDMLEFKGTNTIYYSKLNSNTWEEAKKYYSTTHPVISMAIGTLKNECTIAFTEDSDGNLTASDDVALYGAAITQTPTIMEENYICEYNPQFTRLGGNYVLLWSQLESDTLNIRYTTDLQSITNIANTENVNGAIDYKILQNGSDTWFLFTSASETNSDVFACQYTSAGLGKAVPVTAAEGNIGSVTAIYDDGIELAYTSQIFQSEKNGEETEISSTTDLEYKKVPFQPNLILKSINANQDDVIPGKNLEITMSAENQGLTDITAMQAVVKADDKIISSEKVEENLKIGESKDITISAELPSRMKEKTNLSVELTPAGTTDADTTDNTQSMLIGYVDLAVTAEALLDEENYSKDVIEVENRSFFDGTGKLLIRKENAQGEILKEYPVTLFARKTQEITLSVEDLKQIAQNDDVLYIEVTADSEEFYTSNNSTAVVVEDVSKETVKDTPAPSAPTVTPQKTPAPEQKTTTITLGNIVYTISGDTTAQCTAATEKNLKQIVIPDTIQINGKSYAVTKIAANTFKNQKRLTTLSIGSNIASIGKNAFAGCKKLKNITIKTTKLTTKNVGKKAFAQTSTKATVKVPSKKKAAYQKLLPKKGLNNKAVIKKA